jgi:hypothetical protein
MVVSLTLFLVWSLVVILPISAPWVARVIDMQHNSKLLTEYFDDWKISRNILAKIFSAQKFPLVPGKFLHHVFQIPNIYYIKTYPIIMQVLLFYLCDSSTRPQMILFSWCLAWDVCMNRKNKLFHEIECYDFWYTLHPHSVLLPTVVVCDNY